MACWTRTIRTRAYTRLALGSALLLAAPAWSATDCRRVLDQYEAGLFLLEAALAEQPLSRATAQEVGQLLIDLGGLELEHREECFEPRMRGQTLLRRRATNRPVPTTTDGLDAAGGSDVTSPARTLAALPRLSV